MVVSASWWQLDTVFVFDIYQWSALWVSIKGHHMRRWQFTQDLSSDHLDAYLTNKPEELSHTPPIPHICHSHHCFLSSRRLLVKIMQDAPTLKGGKPLKPVATKFVENNPAVKHAAVAKYKQYKVRCRELGWPGTSNITLRSMDRSAQSLFDNNNSGRCVERQTLPWKVRAHSDMAYDSAVA